MFISMWKKKKKKKKNPYDTVHYFIKFAKQITNVKQQ